MSRLPALPQRPTRGIVAHEPQEGRWEFRMVKGGPILPARIMRINHEPGDPENILDTGPIMIANVGYRDADPIAVWSGYAQPPDHPTDAIHGLPPPWPGGRRERPLTEAEYALKMRQLAWDRDYDPTAPAVQPRKRVDLLTLPPQGP